MDLTKLIKDVFVGVVTFPVYVVSPEKGRSLIDNYASSYLRE